MDGNIFDVQRFSIYDGPGIRTNVFLKGCNLRCLWCHNPESQSAKKQLMFRKNKCVGCGKCARVCSFTFTENCVACGKCAAVCQHDARSIAGQTVSADEIVAKVLRDRAFYKTSGGGVTLTGGEPLLQPDFILEILQKCKENGIDTAIETAGNVPWETFERILPFLDHILYDLKSIDSAKHERLTGVPNERILDNAARLKESGKDILFRMPVIPGLNEDEVGKAAAFASPAKLELLAYHETGCSKYDSLNMPYPAGEITPPTATHMKELAEKYGAIYAATGI